MKDFQKIADIEKCLSILAGLPYHEKGEWVEIDYRDSLVDNLTLFIEGRCDLPDIKSGCADFLKIAHTLADVFNDEEMSNGFEVDNTKNIFSSGPLPGICYLVSCLQSSLFSLYLELLRQLELMPQNGTESENVNQLRCVMWLIDHAWNFVLSGEPSEQFVSDIRGWLEEMIETKELTYLTWGLDIITELQSCVKPCCPCPTA